VPYQRVDLALDENADFVLSPPWVWLSAAGAAIDLTGYTAQMMIRQDRADAAALLTLTQASGITLGATAGTIVVTVTQAQVNALVTALVATRLVAYYDLLLTSPGSVHTRFSEGLVSIDRAATR
jgi:hypothetical protein